MRLLFYSKPGHGKPITDSRGNQEAVGALVDGNDLIVAFVDKFSKCLYIERVINRIDPDPFRSANFAKITDDKAWSAYYSFFKTAEKSIVANQVRRNLRV